MAVWAIPAAIAGAQLVGGLLGQEEQRKGREQQERLLRDYYARLAAIPLPDYEKMKISLAELGTYTPEMEQMISIAPTAMEQVATDPRLAQTQLMNLETLQQIAQAGGFDPTMRADVSQFLRRQEQNVAAQQRAAQQQAEMRGMAGSGAALALQQMAAQSEANRAAEIGERLAAQAFQSRQQALRGATEMAGGIRGQEFGEKSAIAQARDRIAQFQANLAAEQQQRNIQARNVAQQQEIARKQQLAEYNKALIRQRYLDELAKTTGQAGLASGLGQIAAERGRAGAEMWAGIGGAVGTGLGAYQQAQLQQPVSKQVMPKIPKDEIA